jgi:hypothetical protein
MPTYVISYVILMLLCVAVDPKEADGSSILEPFWRMIIGPPLVIFFGLFMMVLGLLMASPLLIWMTSR